MYVVVQLYFLLFWGMIMYMYDNEFETKKKTKFKPRIKLNHNIYNMLVYVILFRLKFFNLHLFSISFFSKP